MNPTKETRRVGTSTLRTAPKLMGTYFKKAVPVLREIKVQKTPSTTNSTEMITESKKSE
jgi:hypothetical protein